MKIDIFKITEAELDILNILWDSNKLLTTAKLSLVIAETYKKTIKPKIIHSLCTDLVQKGFLTYVQISGRNLYMPLIQRDEYQFVIAKLLLAKLFGDSVENLLTVLLRDMDMTKETLSTLKSMLAAAKLPSGEAEQELPEQEVHEPKAFMHKEVAQAKSRQAVGDHHKQAAFSVIPIIAKAFYLPQYYIPKKRLCKAHRPRAA